MIGPGRLFLDYEEQDDESVRANSWHSRATLGSRVTFGSWHQHGHVRPGSDLSEHIEPVHAGQHDVEDHRGMSSARRTLDALEPEALRLRVVLEHLAQLGVVVDHK